MLFNTNSFANRVMWWLVPFAFIVTSLYSLLAAVTLRSIEDETSFRILRAEAVSFQNSAKGSSLPESEIITSYWLDSPQTPVLFRSLPEGLHELTDQHSDFQTGSLTPNSNMNVIVATHSHTARKFVLVVDEAKLTPIDDFESRIELTLLAIASLVLVISIFLAAMIARHLSRPVINLASDISSGHNDGSDFFGADRSDELGQVSRAITELNQKLLASLDRERAFTLFSSHELRTPISTISNAAAVLTLDTISEEKRSRNIERIKQSCQRAEALLQTFLELGRDDIALTQKTLSVEQCFKQLISQQTNAHKQRLLLQGEAKIKANQHLLQVLCANLLNNALLHGEGQIDISLDAKMLCIRNQYVPIEDSRLNFGYGLQIIKRICAKQSWDCKVESINNCFKVQIGFS